MHRYRGAASDEAPLMRPRYAVPSRRASLEGARPASEEPAPNTAEELVQVEEREQEEDEEEPEQYAPTKKGPSSGKKKPTRAKIFGKPTPENTVPKDQRMHTADEVYNRVRWDPALRSDEWFIIYEVFHSSILWVCLCTYVFLTTRRIGSWAWSRCRSMNSIWIRYLSTAFGSSAGARRSSGTGSCASTLSSRTATPRRNSGAPLLQKDIV